ncbi:hypothetical protein O9992_25795 [Vibrio lentus]|nr:hypothetical protein [Vibrio lentus]
MIGLTVDYGKINDSAMVPDGSGGTTPFEEDVVMRYRKLQYLAFSFLPHQ